ncbi:MAG: heavy-metal-associated domain-containing protein [Oscillospiraceae bacterium]|jgi:copper chaperone CopZ|nr:heavy-metal-associated domain-containing protein [Oscillospiraceae bacterium]
MSKTITMQLQGMHCKGCALAAKAALMMRGQVIAAKVAFPEQTAELEVDEARYNPEELTVAVERAGFEVVSIS